MNFQEIYSQFSRIVFNLALQYVQNRENAEEITQDTFVAIHRSIDSFKGNAELSTWVYRIAINKSLDFIKTQKRKKRFAVITSIFHPDSEEILHDYSNFDHPGVLLEQKEAMTEIFKHINELPPNQKTALILSKIEKKSQAEIAEIMKMNTKGVESLIHRAKVNLAKRLNISMK